MVSKADKALLWAVIAVSIIGGLASLAMGFLIDSLL